eukprot:gene12300-14527_t
MSSRPERDGSKVKSKGKRSASSTNAPLEAQIEMESLAKQKAEIPMKMSDKILTQAREQLEEMGDEERKGDELQKEGPSLGRTSLSAKVFAESDSDEDDMDDSEFQDEEVEITEEDEATIARFLNPDAGESRTLADLIMDKIREKEQAGESDMQVAGPSDGPEIAGIDGKVTEVFTEIGTLLSRYKSGKVPKAFKIIPALSNWEEVLHMTNPEGWTPHAMYQATRLFASNLNDKLAQRFYNLVLLPAVRADVRENKKLHFAHFQALKKATYKPGAFYKGLVLPLIASGSCSVREAVIWASVMGRVSLPVVHSSVALVKIAELAYHGTNSFFLQVLLNKKYSLPHKVIDMLVEHYLRFQDEERALPVVWHQSLLTLIQRYKNEMTREGKHKLRELTKVQTHYLISSEIQRELDAVGRARGEKDTTMDSVMVDPLAAGKAAVENLRELPPVIMDEEI